MTNSFNDSPISLPDHDRFGFDPLARALARSIVHIANPEGTVFAVNGPWGAGKTSVLNLVRHHISKAETDPPIEIVDFTCWWFRGEDALTLAFVQQLLGAVKPALSEKAQSDLTKLAKHMLKAKDLIAPALAAIGAAAGAPLAKGAADALDKLLTGEEPVDAQHKRLAQRLREQPRRFLVVVDDLDRLLPDEALQVLRLVKSLGRLPNVMYLLAFDRQIAEKVVAEKYPSEGPHYLEKIIQAAFELPAPSRDDLNNGMLDQIVQLCGEPSEADAVHFMNVFYDCIAPFIRAPRDLSRIASTITVTWPTVKGDVHAAEFAAMETLRIAHGAVYRRLQTAKDLLTAGSSTRGDDDGAETKAKADALLAGVPAADQQTVRDALIRLFPRMEAIWGGMSYGSDFNAEWQKMRRVCSPSHFNTYFAFSVQGDTLPGSVVKELLDRVGDKKKLQEYLLAGLTIARAKDGTRAALLIDELNINGKDIAEEHIATVIEAIYEIADQLDVPADKERGMMAFANNELRIHWLTNRLVKERVSLPARSALLRKASANATLGWLVSLSYRCHGEHVPEKGESKVADNDRLCTLADAALLKRRALTQIRKAAKDGSLLRHAHFPYLLFRWHHDTLKGGTSQASRWLRGCLKDPATTLKIAAAFLQESWSHGSSDRVAKKNTSAGTKSLANLVPLPVFRRALERAVSDRTMPQGERDTGSRFLSLWDRREKRHQEGYHDWD